MFDSCNSMSRRTKRLVVESEGANESSGFKSVRELSESNLCNSRSLIGVGKMGESICSICKCKFKNGHLEANVRYHSRDLTVILDKDSAYFWRRNWICSLSRSASLSGPPRLLNRARTAGCTHSIRVPCLWFILKNVWAHKIKLWNHYNKFHYLL